MSNLYQSEFLEEMADSTSSRLDWVVQHIIDKDSTDLGSRNSLASCVGLNGNDDDDEDGKPLEDNVFRTPRRTRRRGCGAGKARGVVGGGQLNRKANNVTTARQDAIAFRRQVWRFRLGSHGDRCTLSPPEMTARDIRKVRLKCLIGTGGFGSVYLGVFKDRIVAVKKLHRCVKNLAAKVESFRAECNVLHLKHPNIVRVLAASLGDPQTQEAVLVMEHAGERNLQHIVNDVKQKLPFERRTKYALEIAQGLSYIHNNHVVHLDLKPANIIITSRDNCKLADFGCCQVLEDEEDEARVSPPPSTCLGTFAYRAPELLRGEPATTKADIFSFGVTLWQLLTRDAPYSGQNHHVVIFGVVAYNVRPRLPKTGQRGGRCLSPEEKCYVDLFCKCWNADANQRPTAAALVDIFGVWRQQVSTS